MAEIKNKKILEKDLKLAEMLKDRGFGSEKNNILALAPVEALYLLENKRITVKYKKKQLDQKQLTRILKKTNQNIEMQYIVYKDLRTKGYVVRSGFKDEDCFRVYEKGIRVGEGHSHLLVYPVNENKKLTIAEIKRIIQLSHSVKKNILFAVVGKEEITYIKVNKINI